MAIYASADAAQRFYEGLAQQSPEESNEAKPLAMPALSDQASVPDHVVDACRGLRLRNPGFHSGLSGRLRRQHQYSLSEMRMRIVSSGAYHPGHAKTLRIRLFPAP
ncbi:hypothetical protein [Streptomyces sp. NPDC005828]|uniref:hypothetical protein n=1 Tax=Streptomyces sp. NPDC005828 TaxID=3157071 RepID=UPI0033ECB864